MNTKKTNKCLTICCIVMLIIGCVFIGRSVRSSANDLPIDGYYEYNFETKKESTFTVSIPEGAESELVMEGFDGTEADIASALEAGEGGEITPYSVIGSDGRVRVGNTKIMPNKWIAYIVSYWPDGTATRGTAWMYGPSVAMTAAHCIYNTTKKCYPQKIVVYPGYDDGTAPFGSYTVVKASVPKNYRSSGSSSYDFGAIKLSSAYGTRKGYFGVRYTQSSLTGQKVFITGYPADKGKQLWRMSGTISSCTSSRLLYQIDTYGGQSGSPIYVAEGTKRYCVGIHTTGTSNTVDGYNGGTRITKAVFTWMRRQRQVWE